MALRGSTARAVDWVKVHGGAKMNKCQANLTDLRMHDGSRMFLSLPESVPWNRTRDYITKLSGAVVTGYLTDNVTEVWIDFDYQGYRFTINNPCGEYWFFVHEASCPESVLKSVAEHFAAF